MRDGERERDGERWEKERKGESREQRTSISPVQW